MLYLTIHWSSQPRLVVSNHTHWSIHPVLYPIIHWSSHPTPSCTHPYTTEWLAAPVYLTIRWSSVDNSTTHTDIGASGGYSRVGNVAGPSSGGCNADRKLVPIGKETASNTVWVTLHTATARITLIDGHHPEVVCLCHLAAVSLDIERSGVTQSTQAVQVGYKPYKLDFCWTQSCIAWIC